MNLLVHGSTSAAVALALAAGAVVGCFTGDGLFGQPCRTDDDCNAVAAASGQHIACQDGVCGAVCGDGVLVDGAEECDDGNDVDNDACVGCKTAVCGDDVTQDGVEQCDDGNNIAEDACVGCTLAICGDGIVWAGEEECDDGDDDSADACADCLTVACGDGRLNPATELCDDGNREPNDGCNAGCEPGAEQLASGLGSHTCVLGSGALRCWGTNTKGQLGGGSVAAVGDEASDLPPADVPFAGVRVTGMAVGAEHTCALLGDDGDDVRCWGSNGAGQLGLPGELLIGDEQGEPLGPSVDLGGPARELSAGRAHTCARLSGGLVRCWGDNTFGQLGYPAIPAIGLIDDPASHPTLALAPVRQLSAGGTHTCAVLEADRSIRCWGRNWSDQLGFDAPGTVVSDPSKSMPVAFGGRAVERVSAGGSHTCALLADDHGVYCWGANGAGQVGHDEVLGDDPENPTAKVAAVDLGGQRAEQIQAGGTHTCAVLEGGDVWCWGHTTFTIMTDGKQGDHVVGVRSPPTRMNLAGTARAVALGVTHTCALFDGGGVACWGVNGDGQLGLGNGAIIGDDPDEWPPRPAILYPTLEDGA